MRDKARLSALWTPVVLLDAAVVLAPALTGISALWLGFWFLAGLCATCIGYLTFGPFPESGGTVLWPSIRVAIPTKLFALAMFGRTGHWLLLVAVALVGPTVAAAVWGLGPLGWVLLLYLTATGTAGRRYQQFTVVSWGGAVVASAGCVAVVLSQPVEIRAAGWLLAAGIATAVVGMLSHCLNSLTISWGMKTASSADLEHDWRAESWLAVLATTIAAVAACIVALPVALISGGAAPPLGGVALSVTFGAVAGAVPVVWSRVVMARITVATVAIVSTSTPAVSVAYLAILGQLGGIQTWLLLIGVIGVVCGASAAMHQPSTTRSKAALQPSPS